MPLGGNTTKRKSSSMGRAGAPLTPYEIQSQPAYPSGIRYRSRGRLHPRLATAMTIPRRTSLLAMASNDTWTGLCGATTLTALAHVATIQDSQHPTQAPDFSP